MNRPRPPHPRSAPDEPASVVIRRPAPGLIGDPRPTPIRLPHPASHLIRGPGDLLIRLPHFAVTGDIDPVPVSVQVLRTGVIGISPLPRGSVLNHVVAIFVPAVPVISGGRADNLVLRVVHATDDDH